MIVIIGSPLVVPGDPGQRSRAAGRAFEVALGASDGGSAVQLVGKVGDDPAGDALILALADAGIGHVALLRDPARSTPVSVPTATDLDASALEDSAFDAVDDPGALPEPVATAGPDDRPVVDAGDLDLALRYLPDHQVVVVTEPLAADAFAVVLADCAYVGATLVVVLEAGAAAPDLPSSATAFEAPGSDPDGLFARTVGGFAAGLDQGTGAAQALDRATTSAGWQPASS